ncbi:DUF4263 domain-containing protein [Cocleimonas flava]|uniref:Uncharacterized protein DUF4263 n=1 Tax=Cocleimonas flava TaxID=634765 RepID=A0A4R1F064_9GAMM|nr:Shedu anti-phage system protein SduA domain-containing protein [Cocleimonas flava]TCJ87576.1 uncharacterized protein DUF4263 [Cocleimonas flava]
MESNENKDTTLADVISETLSDIEKNAPKLQNSIQQFHKLLDNCQNESEMQKFLEGSLYYLPGLRDLHNGVMEDTIVTKMPLGSDHITDFAFVSRNSMNMQYTLIEIEDPNKNIFTKGDQFSSYFNHALQQIKDWQLWFNKNGTYLDKSFNDIVNYRVDTSDDYKSFKAYLVYGRRSEINNRVRKDRWQNLEKSLGEELKVMSYDRLASNIECASSNTIDILTVFRHFESLKLRSYRKKTFYPKNI